MILFLMGCNMYAGHSRRIFSMHKNTCILLLSKCAVYNRNISVLNKPALIIDVVFNIFKVQQNVLDS